ncbi:tetratricopeptide repeat protein [Flagellimonas lutaonensis]|uniref:Uncharacterized protein n=1 Tax=Flagellimonas lutaonensis TaxID=516051 RepID=A0A0D5YW43_9FLAO|nr:hypothetical protein [Allomuricauda lutaonensis]AKA36104.1 hypothetical protein VC82_2536 [Allomuricauda lutaonensis]
MESENITIVVQPIEGHGANDSLPIFCKALTADLITELAQFKQFLIKSRSADILTSLQREGDYLVQGSITQLGNEVNLNIHLTRLRDDSIVWAYRNGGNITSIQQVQQQMIGNLVASLQQQLDLDLLNQIRKRNVTDFKAYEYWLYGFEALKKGSVTADEEARVYFTKALQIDPNYSLAYSGMSLSYFNEWSCQVWDRWELNQNGAKEWAMKALELDPDNYIANMILGRVLLFEHCFQESEIYLRKGLRFNRSDPFNLIQIAGAFIYLNYLEEAEDLYKKALLLNPEHEEKYHPIGAYIYFEQRDFEKSIKTGERFVKMGWVDYPVIMAASYFYEGNLNQSNHYWKQYLCNFSERISRDRVNLESEALQWMINLNPYRYKSAFQPFWDYICNKTGIVIIKPEEDLNISNSFQKEEHTWKLAYLGKEAHLPHSKGMLDIAYLLKNAGEAIKAEVLLGGQVRQTTVELTDKEALLNIKSRLEEIEALLADARDEDMNETESLKREYDQLTEYISSVLDNKGRIRVKGSTSDKARSAVTQRIRSALRKIEQVHPELYQHLSSTIKTGNYCSYQPEKKIDWDL